MEKKILIPIILVIIIISAAIITSIVYSNENNDNPGDEIPPIAEQEGTEYIESTGEVTSINDLESLLDYTHEDSPERKKLDFILSNRELVRNNIGEAPLISIINSKRNIDLYNTSTEVVEYNETHAVLNLVIEINYSGDNRKTSRKKVVLKKKQGLWKVWNSTIIPELRD